MGIPAAGANDNDGDGWVYLRNGDEENYREWIKPFDEPLVDNSALFSLPYSNQ